MRGAPISLLFPGIVFHFGNSRIAAFSSYIGTLCAPKWAISTVLRRARRRNINFLATTLESLSASQSSGGLKKRFI